MRFPVPGGVRRINIIQLNIYVMNKTIATALLGCAFGLTAQAQTMTVTSADGIPTRFNTDYVRSVEFIEVSQSETEVFKTLTAKGGSNGTADLLFADGDNKVRLYVCGPKTSEYLQAGIYTVSPSNAEMTVDSDPEWSFLLLDGERKALQSGEMVVSNVGNNYTITMNFTLTDGTVFKGLYTGDVAGYSELVTLDASGVNVVDINDPKPGEFYMRFNNDSWSFEMVIDFFDSPEAETLTPGTYTYSDECKPGTFGPRSVLDLYNPNSSNRVQGTVTVTREDDIYDMQFDLTLANGRKATGSYRGEIKY